VSQFLHFFNIFIQWVSIVSLNSLDCCVSEMMSCR
jgi:hypothetical protein